MYTPFSHTFTNMPPFNTHSCKHTHLPSGYKEVSKECMQGGYSVTLFYPVSLSLGKLSEEEKKAAHHRTLDSQARLSTLGLTP